MRKTIFLLILIMGMLNVRANKAAIDTVYDPVAELALLHAFYSDTGKLSFQCTFYMQDIDTITTNDTMVGYYQMHNEKFRIVIDSVESLQDDLYNMTAYYGDSLILVQRRAEVSQKVTQLNLYDPALRNDFIDSISVHDSTAALRILKFHFKFNAPFEEYKILYDTTHKMISINYSARKYPMQNVLQFARYPLNNEEVDDFRLTIKMVFSNYQFGGFDDSVFNTSKFAIREKGAFKLVPPYTNYELVNSTIQ
jgi:hypothetical protein